jgi:hypothetical protein
MLGFENDDNAFREINPRLDGVNVSAKQPKPTPATKTTVQNSNRQGHPVINSRVAKPSGTT